ncbi:MAG TPA: nucleotide pyrophosphatase, partial [Verrucomicrobiae bacterium]|nr:nucleotide pyrophosphatase [Verrucomicrobiae bacterium]
MKTVLPLFIFIDACGWEIIKGGRFARDFAPNRKRLESVFGYSSTCVPSILSGHWPVEHHNWCYFVYDPVNSPFKSLRKFSWLPKFITSRRRFRRWLSKFVKARLSFRGYFDLYNIPFKYISLFDFTEKKSPLQPGGMNCGG